MELSKKVDINNILEIINKLSDNDRLTFSNINRKMKYLVNKYETDWEKIVSTKSSMYINNVMTSKPETYLEKKLYWHIYKYNKEYKKLIKKVSKSKYQGLVIDMENLIYIPE